MGRAGPGGGRGARLVGQWAPGGQKPVLISPSQEHSSGCPVYVGLLCESWVEKDELVMDGGVVGGPWASSSCSQSVCLSIST